MTAQFCVDVKEAKLAQSLFLAWLNMTQENTFAISFRLFKGYRQRYLIFFH